MAIAGEFMQPRKLRSGPRQGPRAWRGSCLGAAAKIAARIKLARALIVLMSNFRGYAGVVAAPYSNAR